jgi:hypothetical protein
MIKEEQYCQTCAHGMFLDDATVKVICLLDEKIDLSKPVEDSQYGEATKRANDSVCDCGKYDKHPDYFEYEEEEDNCKACNCSIEDCYSCYIHPAKRYMVGGWVEPEMYGCSINGCIDEADSASQLCHVAYESLANAIHSIYRKETIKESINDAREDLRGGIHLVSALDQLQLQHICCMNEYSEMYSEIVKEMAKKKKDTSCMQT